MPLGVLQTVVAAYSGVAFDEDLADRIRELVGAESDLTEKRMFGGLAFLINGYMTVAASGRGGLLLRVDPAETERLLQRPHTHAFVSRGREMDGWLRVDADGVRTKRQLEGWITRALANVRTLPPKAVTPRRRAQRAQ